MGLIERLKKSSTIDTTDVLSDSKYFKDIGYAPTPIPIINLIQSGSFTGGMSRGSTIFAGGSKNFKSAFTLLEVKAFFDKYPDAVCLFYDSEWGAPPAYFASFGIPQEKVLHIPVGDVEELTHDMIVQLGEIEEGKDHVIIVVDSFGNLASRKEAKDALEGNDKADFTKPKRVKGLFRMILKSLNTKDIPLLGIGHTYKDIMAMYPKDIISGGTGQYYGANNIYIITRNQTDLEKDEGFNFVMNVEKSRFVREKIKVSIEVTYEGGINMWSGLFDLALEGGFIEEAGKGWYKVKGGDTKKRRLDFNTEAYWVPMLKNKDFIQFCEDKFKLPTGGIVHDISDEEIEEDMKDA